MSQINLNTKTGFNFDNSYAGLPDLLFTIQNPQPVGLPNLVIFNHNFAKSLGLNDENFQSKDGIEILSGNRIPKGALPLAQAYAGHQFGYFTMLGDGRAILLGEHITPTNDRADIQLKGSGRTPYSRGGDGRAALGPMLREYIISEAMYGLGIPTTRSLAVVTTGESIIRQKEEKGAILTRVASSHIRVGTFQYVSKWGTVQELKALADYTLERHFKDYHGQENKYLFLLKEVIKRQAELIAKWQLVGFIHGVMNTDNMAISGETIDYGPCAFMDNYDIDTVFSSIDTSGRYAYGNQPSMAAWNLARFAETLLPLLHSDKDEAIKLAQNAVLEFNGLYNKNWIRGMRSKLGIFNEEDSDEELIIDLLTMMQKYKVDYTNTFIALTFNTLDNMEIFKSEEFKLWHERWKERLTRQGETKELSHELMKSCNPALIPRNHLVEKALEAANNEDYSIMESFLKALSNPYAHSSRQLEYSKIPPTSSCSYRTYCGT